MKKRKLKTPARGAWLLLPSLAGVTVFMLYPLGKTVYHSFFSRISGGRFVGLKNYSELLSNGAFRLAVGNTASFYLIALPLIIILPLAAALIFSGTGRLERLFGRTMYLTILLPSASLMTVISLMFAPDGIFSEAAAALFGLDPDRLYESEFAFVLLVALFVYRYGGFNYLICRAALAGIPVEYYEEAMLAGAGRLDCVRYVTLPGLMPVLPAVLTLSILNSYKIYREAYLIGGSYPDDSIYLIQHFINNNFVNMNFSRLCAAAAVMLATAILAALALTAVLRLAGRTPDETK